MYKYLTVAILFVSVSAQSTVVLTRWGNGEECVFKNDQITKTVSLHEGKLSFTTTKKITSKGIEAYAQKALSLSTAEQGGVPGFGNQVEINGVKGMLQFDDSVEARMLISFLVNACN